MIGFVRRLRGSRRFPRAAVVSVGTVLTAAAAWLWAHEGHAPLPSKGVQVNAAKGQIVLSKEAREALDVRSAEVVNRPLPEKLLAPATVVAPWGHHAFTTPRLPGRVVSLAVKPGQRVEAGDVLAEVHSGELEALRLELLSAKTESGLSGKILQALQDAPEAVPGQQILDAQTRHRQNLNTLEVA